MNVNSTSTSLPGLTPIVLGLAAALLIGAVLTGRQWPLIGDARVALALLLVLGMATCGSGGIGPAIAEARWTAPLALISIALGVVILAVGALALFGIALPGIADARQAFVAIAILSAVKLVLTLLDRVI